MRSGRAARACLQTAPCEGLHVRHFLATKDMLHDLLKRVDFSGPSAFTPPPVRVIVGLGQELVYLTRNLCCNWIWLSRSGSSCTSRGRAPPANEAGDQWRINLSHCVN